MLSLKEITLAYIIGILWGLYLEMNTLIMTSIFLFVFVLMFLKEYKYKLLIVLIVCMVGCLYTDMKIIDYKTRYKDNEEVNLIVTIISQCIEKDFTYKYNCRVENGEKFILYFSKKQGGAFNIGEKLKINGIFNLPEVARNIGGFNYRMYLNSNGFFRNNIS